MRVVDDLALGRLLIATTVIVHTVSLVAISRTLVLFVRWGRLHAHPAAPDFALDLTGSPTRFRKIRQVIQIAAPSRVAT